LSRLRTIDAPTLLLAGRHDWIMPPGPGVERMHEQMPGSELVVFEESGHFPFIEEQERFVSVVGDWLAKVRPGGPENGSR